MGKDRVTDTRAYLNNVELGASQNVCTKVASEEMICTTKKSTADFVRTLRYKL